MGCFVLLYFLVGRSNVAFRVILFCRTASQRRLSYAFRGGLHAFALGIFSPRRLWRLHHLPPRERLSALRRRGGVHGAPPLRILRRPRALRHPLPRDAALG